MQYSQQIIVKRRIPISKEHERTKAKVEIIKWVAGMLVTQAAIVAALVKLL